MSTPGLAEGGLIVIVDDNESRRYAKARVLRQRAYEVLEAATGEEGLRLIDERRPRLAVVDVGLPDMSGHEVCQRIKSGAHTASIPVLQISATFVTEADTVASLDSGADASLVGPVEPAVLLATVRALLRARQAEELMREALGREQAARSAAEDANRIKDEFLAVLSHELRSPLSAILTWSTLLREGGLDPARRAQGLASIERNARLQTKLVEDLLDVSRIISGKTVFEIGLVELAPAVDAAMESMRAAAEAKGISMFATVDPTVGPIHADPTRLQQVIWNLLSNAVKFTPRGGSVRLEVEGVDSQVVLRVRDTGCGIPAEFLPHVFERFRQADASTTRAEGGLGLGLAIVRHIVEMHGGSVRVESPGVGRGSTFTVVLPVPAVRTNVARPHDRGIARRSAHERLDGLRLLIVDDEGDTRDAVAAMLEGHGASVTTAESAPAAFDAVCGTPQPFDVLISDIGMPGEDGYSLIRRVRRWEESQGRRIPTLALSAYANVAEVERIRLAGFDVALTKPVDSDELVGQVAELARSRVRLE